MRVHCGSRYYPCKPALLPWSVSRASNRLTAGLCWDAERRRTLLELGLRSHNVRTRVMAHVNEMRTVFSDNWEDAYGVLYERWKEQCAVYAEMRVRARAAAASGDAPDDGEDDAADVWGRAEALESEMAHLRAARMASEAM